MKTGLLGIMAVVFSMTLTTISAEEKFREFRSSDGKSISAKLLYHKGSGSVTMELANGKKVKVPILRFSEDDQKYLNDWVKANPPKIKYAFKYEVDTERDTIKRAGGYYDRSKSGKHAYNVTITNMSRDTVTDMVVKYQMYMLNNTSGAGSYEYGDEYMQTDEIPLKADIPYNHEREFTSKAFRIDEERYSYYYSRNNRKDVMEGIIIRMYDKTGKLVDEWKSQAAERAKRTWIDPKKKKGRDRDVEEPPIRID